jgi:hypothetical protein
MNDPLSALPTYSNNIGHIHRFNAPLLASANILIPQTRTQVVEILAKIEIPEGISAIVYCNLLV